MDRPVRRALAAAVAGLALLASCSDNPEPAPLEVSGSPSASPSADAAPEMPEEARENTPEGAEAFVRYWVEVLNAAGAEGDVKALHKLSLRSCDTCTGIADGIARVYADGGSIEGEGWSIESASVLPGADNTLVIDTQVNVAAQSVVESEGAAPQSFPGGKDLKIFTTSWSADGWRLARLEQPR